MTFSILLFLALLPLLLAETMPSGSPDPLLLRAARGEDVTRLPVWMMRQAGRHMQAYRSVPLFWCSRVIILVFDSTRLTI